MRLMSSWGRGSLIVVGGRRGGGRGGRMGGVIEVVEGIGRGLYDYVYMMGG